jgi:hypothetical protein
MALERTIALHFLRTGQFDTAGIFLQVSFLNSYASLVGLNIRNRKLV